MKKYIISGVFIAGFLMVLGIHKLSFHRVDGNKNEQQIVSSLKDYKEDLMLQVPETKVVSTLVFQPKTSFYQGLYADGPDQGTVELYSQNAVEISKVGDIKNERYFVVPFTVSRQGTGVFWYLGLLRLNSSDDQKYVHISSQFLGDRTPVVSLTDQIQGVEVTYKTRKKSTPMAAKPDTKKIIFLPINKKGFQGE